MMPLFDVARYHGNTGDGCFAQLDIASIHLASERIIAAFDTKGRFLQAWNLSE